MSTDLSWKTLIRNGIWAQCANGGGSLSAGESRESSKQLMAIGKTVARPTPGILVTVITWSIRLH